VVAGGKTIEVARVRITDARRRALADAETREAAMAAFAKSWRRES
jgi:hypothetical protein